MTKFRIILYSTYVFLFCTLMAILSFVDKNSIVYNIFNPILGLVIITLPICIIITVVRLENERMKKNKQESKETFNNLSEEEKQKYYEKRRKYELEMQKTKESKKQKNELEKQKTAEKTAIIKTIIIGTNGKITTDINDSLIGGLAGGMLFGPAGLIAGATSGKKEIKNETIFLVKYADGHKNIVTAKNNSIKFKKLCKHLDI